MSRSRTVPLLAAMILCLAIAPAGPAQLRDRLRERFTDALAPRPEPVAETKLLMDGVFRANFNGLGRILKDKPTEPEAWTFARGQALLIAEGGNLLMMRPPTEERARSEWFARAADLRTAATDVARSVAAKDYAESRATLATLANSCNRCHTAFAVPTRVTPFQATE